MTHKKIEHDHLDDKDAKVVLASTFAKSFNSMPKLLRWCTIISIIIGSFYFIVVQKYVKEFKEDDQIVLMQSSIKELSMKVKIIESNQINSMEIYEEVEEIQKIFNIFSEFERKKVKGFIHFLRTSHGRKFDKNQYENAINHFENEDISLQIEYQKEVEKIFKNRLQKRLRIKNDSSNDENDN